MTQAHPATRRYRLARFAALALLLIPLTALSQGGLSSLFGGNSNNGDDVLPVEEAFVITANRVADDELAVAIDIQPGYYLYRDSLAMTVGDNAIDTAAIDFPSAKTKEDEFFGVQPVYTEPATLIAPIPPATGDDAPVTVDFQGCSESGVCYPPYTVSTRLDGGAGDYAINPEAPAVGTTDSGAENPVAEAQPSAGGGEAGRLERLLNEASVPAMLAGFFAAGILLAFTACLYPMIPILSGLIAGDPHRSGSLRALGLSLVYVESTAITYALAGVAAGLTGAAIQADLQSPWVLGAFAAMFVILALGMFGVFEFRIPTALQTRLTTLSNRQRGGTLVGVAIMGILSTLIVGACSGPALIAALVFIGSTGDAWLGGLALFTLANGMGLPLLLIGTAAGRWLPHSGPWMNTVRAIFGVGFLAVALWMLERFLAGPIVLALWGVLFIGAGVWLGATERLTPPVRPAQRLARTLGLALMVWGGASLVGAAAGGGDVLRPLAGVGGTGGTSATEGLAFRDIESPGELEVALQDAKAAGRPVMIDIYADWCVYCVQLEQRTFTDPRVQEAVAKAMLLRADVTAMNDNHRALMQRLEVYLPPAIIFYGPDGQENRDARVLGFLDADPFIARARAGLSER
ncbi:MAG: protein-disulfide reductase DsbD [Spiribacter salinus]|uniref:Thiol:disulfide interchange protein DsbD n=1 Tax=Spiribacter salinus TaxID=1335746 RepID=A0A540VTD5_9GAMM|nr:MAG: protein-disulfide reductase DsbD [Spiribacter salinus]